MQGADKGLIRSLITAEYANILTTVRKRQKGLRITHLPYIMLTGDSKDGLRLIEYAKGIGKEHSNTAKAVMRVIKSGYLLKGSDKRYRLTDKGQQVYNAVCTAFNPSLEKIIKILTVEYLRRAQK